MARSMAFNADHFLCPLDDSAWPPSQPAQHIPQHRGLVKQPDIPQLKHAQDWPSTQNAVLRSAPPRNFSRPSQQSYAQQSSFPAYDVDPHDDYKEIIRSPASVDRGTGGKTHNFNPSATSTVNSSASTTEYSPSSSRPPSLTLSNSRDSEFGHNDSPITPHRPFVFNGAVGSNNNASNAPHPFLLAPPTAQAFPQGSAGGNEGRSVSPVPSTSGGGAGASEVKSKFSRLRSAASASNLARNFAKKGKESSTGKKGGKDVSSASKSGLDDRNASAFPRQSSEQYRPTSPGGFSLSSWEEGRTGMQSRKSSVVKDEEPSSERSHIAARQEPFEGGGDTIKKNKAGKLWGHLFSKQSQQQDCASEPIASQGSHQQPALVQHAHAGSSKVDRLLGVGVEDRLRIDQTSSPQPGGGEHLSGLNETPRPLRAEVVPPKMPTRDLLAEYSADWRPPYRHGASSRSFTPGHQRQQGSRDSNKSNISTSSAGSSSKEMRKALHHHKLSTSSRDSFATASTTESRISDQAPVLAHPLMLAGRDLSDDIEAVLRSQRSSIRDLQDLLNAHRQITKQRASLLPHRGSREKPLTSSSSTASSSAYMTKPLSSLASSAAHSPQTSLSSLPPSGPSIHANQSSLSSSNTDWSTSSRSHSTAFSSNNGPVLRLLDDRGAHMLTKPPRLLPKSELRKGSTDSGEMERMRSEPLQTISGKLTPDQFQDAPEAGSARLPSRTRMERDASGETVLGVASLRPHNFSQTRPGLKGAATSDGLLTLPSLQRVTNQAALDHDVSSTRDEKLSRKDNPCTDGPTMTSSLALQAQAARALTSLPPLSSLLEACLVASANSSQMGKGAWQEVEEQQPELLSRSTPREQLPNSWSDYVAAYARGEIDLSQPPLPLTGPVVSTASQTSANSSAVGRQNAFGPTGTESGLMFSGKGKSLGGTSYGAGMDFVFPRPSNRQVGSGATGGSSSFMRMLKNPRRNASSGEASGRSTPAMSRVGSIAEGEGLDEYLGGHDETPSLNAAETGPHGGIGDMKAVRPPYEGKRQQATQLYLSALGLLDGQHCRSRQASSDRASLLQSAKLYRNAKLISIVEQIAGLLNTAEASIQLLSEDVVVTIAQTGQRIGLVEDAARTPRPDTGDGRIRGGAGALGVDLFDGLDSRRGSLADELTLRDNSLDAHAILSRHGAPVAIPHVQSDWRFSARNGSSGSSGSAAFWGAASIISSDGMPVGTISVYDFLPRPEGLSKDERAQLAEAAREAGVELERTRRVALGNRLALFDESLSSWSMTDHQLSVCKHVATDSGNTNLLVPPGSQHLRSSPTLSLQPPPSPNGSLAQRRGVKAPRNLNVEGAISAAARNEIQPPQLAALQAALPTIASALNMDLAYIAHVKSGKGSSSADGSDGVDCSLIARYDSGLSTAAPVLMFDGPLHLCALAATKRGLYFQQEPHRASQLLGQPLPTGADYTSDTFHTAAVVSCGMKEASRGCKPSEGWVLAVASCSPHARMSPEATIYLLRFASLLAPFLNDGRPRSPLSSSNVGSSGVLIPTRPASRARGLSSPALPKFRPPFLGSENRSRSISYSRGSPGSISSPPLPPPSGALPSPPPFSPSVASVFPGRSGSSPVMSLKRLAAIAPMAPLPLSPPPTDPLPAVPKSAGLGGATVAVSSPLRSTSPLPLSPTTTYPSCIQQGESSSSPARPAAPLRSTSQPRTNRDHVQQQNITTDNHRTAMHRHQARSSSAQLGGAAVETLARSLPRSTANATTDLPRFREPIGRL